MTRWPYVPFKDIVKTSAFGPRFSGSAYSKEGNLATLRTTDLDNDGRISYETMPLADLDEDKFSSHLLQLGDLVISRSGTCGIAAVFEGFSLPVLPGAFLIRFRLNEEIEPHFYKYYFNSADGRQNILSVARGAVQQNLNITNVEELRVPLPSNEEQGRIVRILSAYDDLIENNRRRMVLLENAARQLYREWFVRLRFPGSEHTRMVDGIPQDWQNRRLGDLVVLNYGKALKAEDRVDGDIPVFGSSGVVGFHDSPLSLGPGIIVGRKGNVGSIYWSPTPFYAIDTVYFISPDTADLYWYYALAHTHFMSTDVAVPGLNRELAYSRLVLVPAPGLKRAFLDVAEPIHDQIKNLDTANQRLQTARDLLLPRLMSGEIAV